MITAAGVGSGIDVESILSQLMELERQPIEVLNRKKERLDVELSAFGTVKSALNELAGSIRNLGDANELAPFVATSSSEEVLTAVATGGGAGETHEIDVQSLASSHRLASRSYASADDTVTTGTWSFSSGDNSFEVDIVGPDNSLSDLRDAINDAPDNESIVASFLNVDGGTRLVLSARESGTEHAIVLGDKAAQRGGGGLLGGGSSGPDFDEVTAASDASLTVDGFNVTSSSNAVSDVITGVTLNLVGTGRAEVSTTRDTEQLETRIGEFVSRYNDLRSGLQTLADGELNGDRMPRTIERKIREAFISPLTQANGTSLSPLAMGFTFDRFGALSIDSTAQAESVKGSLENYVNLFAQSETGFAERLEGILAPYTQAGGIIDGREEGINNRQQSLDDQIERLDYRLEKIEARYRRQFTTMDQLVTNLQSTSSFLANRLQANV